MNTPPFTYTVGTGSNDVIVTMTPEPEPEFPWHWPPSQRRMFVEIIEASERLAAKRAADAP